MAYLDKFDPAKVERVIRQLLAEDFTWGEIGRRFGCSGGPVRDRAKELGLDRPPPVGVGTQKKYPTRTIEPRERSVEGS